MTTATVRGGRAGATARRDRWWISPLLTATGLIAFAVYSIVVAVAGADYLYTESGAHYLSPFYSPDLKSWGLDLPFSYAFLVMWVPLGFRLTCYYYRKAYYRAFFLSPPACAVAGPRRRRYRGEASLPFVLLNAHRYFLLLATIVLGFLWYDAGRAFLFRGSDSSLHLGVGLGTLILLANVVLLSLFTFGATRSVTWSAASSTASRAPPRRVRGTGSGVASAVSTRGTWDGLGSAWAGSPSLTSMSGSPRAACSTTRGSCDGCRAA